MKISFSTSKNKYLLYTGQNSYVDVLDVVAILTQEDLEHIAKEEEYDWVTIRIVERLEEKENRYYYKDASKLKHILVDGLFTLKRSKEVTLSRKGQSYFSRLSRMKYNLELATQMGIELQLKNKILTEGESHDKNEEHILGL